jgi:hypothetical protein
MILIGDPYFVFDYALKLMNHEANCWFLLYLNSWNIKVIHTLIEALLILRESSLAGMAGAIHNLIKINI